MPNATGFPSFVNWPKHNDILHQQMWIDDQHPQTRRRAPGESNRAKIKASP